MWGREEGKKSSICFSPCTLASESASWFIKACYSPFYFPLEKQTISIQLHLLGKQNRKNWSFGGVFFWFGFFCCCCQFFVLFFSTTGNIKHTEEGDTTKQVLSYSNSVQLHCSQWSYTDLDYMVNLHQSPPTPSLTPESREVESKHWRESNT